MQRRTPLGLIAAVMVVLSAKGYAQEADIKAAIGKYHAAIESLDMNKMEPLWALAEHCRSTIAKGMADAIAGRGIALVEGG